MARNVWLTFSEWEQITEELSHLGWHSFKLNSYDIEQWEKRSDNPLCFKRVDLYFYVNEVKSDYLKNVLCREHWRSQDMIRTMNYSLEFIGFILNHCEDVNMNMSFNQWEEIRNSMNNMISKSDKRQWWPEELINLYKECESVTVV